jgi:uncharacterized repeat protein (TIGR03803 family)
MRDHTQRCGRISRRLRTAGRLLLVAVLAPLCRVTLAAEAQSNDAWTFHLLYQFKAGAGGAEPYATPIIDSKGNLYSTTCNDGAFASGVVWKLSPAGKETVLYNFKQTGGGGGMPYSSLIMDAAGNVYGTTQFRGIYGGPCGALGCGTVFKVDPSGKETVLHRFTGKANDGMTSEQGLVADPAGSLYGTTIRGGANGIGVIFKIDPSGKWTILHSFDFNVEGFFPYGGTLLRDAAGNLYGTTEVGGSGGASGTVFKLDPSGKVTVLHGFSSSGDGASPIGNLVRDAAGSFYGVTNSGGAFGFGTVFKIDAKGVETVLYSFGGTRGDGVNPVGGLVRDRAGSLYGTTNSGGAHYLGTVFKLDPANKETILHNFDGATGRNPEFALLQDSKGTLYGTAFQGGAYGGGVVFKMTH